MALKRSPKVLELPRRARHARHARWQAAVEALDSRIADIERYLGDGGQPYSASSNTRMRFPAALVASIAVHLLVIFGITFKVPDRSLPDNRNSLEVVLVNAKSKTTPEKADALAQHALDGGGNTDEARRAQSPLPVVPQKKPERDVKLALRKVERLEREAQQLLTQSKAPVAVETAPAPAKAAPPAEDEPKPALRAADILQRSLQVARLEAQISRDWDSYQQRPRKHFVGARVQEYRFARYVEDWRTKIERIGDLNYPQAAREQKLSGNLTVTVAIRADGTVEQIEINRPSGHKILDDAARRIVRLAAPFAPFPPDIAKDVDILYITRRWTFTAADRFVAE